MVKEKRIDPEVFQRMMKEKTAHAEALRTHQDEKQSVLNGIEREIRRVRGGAMARQTFNASMPRMKKELSRLDAAIRRDILGVSSVSQRTNQLAQRQSPRSFRISSRGISTVTRKKTKRRGTIRRAATKTRKTTSARRTTRRTARSTTRRTAARRKK